MVHLRLQHCVWAIFTALPWCAVAADADFKIVWLDIGEVAASDGRGSPRAGRHLFMADYLMNLSLQGTRIAQVVAEPAITEVTIGTRLCLSSLSIVALNGEGRVVAGAPLSISVRQDHRGDLGLERTESDVCMRPVTTGEYPIRLSSLLPADDGSNRGAQFFLRVNHPPSFDVSETQPLKR
jgi:hypothetical protein